MRIYYGNGEVRLEGAVDVAAFEIDTKVRLMQIQNCLIVGL